MENILEVKNITKKYDGFTLSDVTFAIPENTAVGFIGQNGAGKTTTINAILNFIRPDAGEIRIFGKDHKKNEFEIKEDLAVVFDELPYPDQFSVTNVNTMLKGTYRAWDEEVFFSYIEKFELPRKKKLNKFSKGMKMKLQLAAALSHHAKFLVMDEATTGLDPIFRNEVLDLLKEYKKNTGCSILISSHITSDIEKMAESVLFIDRGKIVLYDTRDHILATHKMIPASFVSEKLPEEISRRELNGQDMIMIKDYTGDLPVLDMTLEEVMIFYVSGGADE